MSEDSEELREQLAQIQSMMHHDAVMEGVQTFVASIRLMVSELEDCGFEPEQARGIITAMFTGGGKR